MPEKPDKPHRIRVRTLDGNPRDQSALNKLRSNQLGMPHLDIIATNVAAEFIICASKDAHIEQVRAKLQSAGLEVIEGGDTAVAAPAAPKPAPQQPREGRYQQQRGSHPQRSREQQRPRQGPQQGSVSTAQPLPGKPYGFVSLPKDFVTAPPIWHDGTSSAGRLSGEIRFELETLTPLLVGWERGQVGDNESDWPVPTHLDGVGQLANHKSVLCPLRAPWGKRPVIIPGDSLKGLLRHELGALLGAPMEHVAERSYSYRPNALFPNQPNPRLIARIARVPHDGVVMKALDENTQVRVPTKLELLSTELRYDKRGKLHTNYYRFDDVSGATYRGGQGAGEKLNSKRNLHKKLTVNPSPPTETATLSPAVQDGYLATIRHLINEASGHFSERHPDVPKVVTGDAARSRILKAAQEEVFQPGDLIWVEWDTEKKCIVSLGWHYYYRWAYTDTVRKTGGKLERHGLFPLEAERSLDGNKGDKHRPPKELSWVRRLFGYTGDNEGSAGIGTGDHAQFMGRVFVNAALEVVGENDSDDGRFLKPTFLKELGMPRPSAVEHYLKQPHHPRPRPSDNATLVTYGDAAGYDTPGELAGRKFYLDRKDAYGPDGKGLVPGPAADHSDANRQNDRSTLALEASKPGRKFRFTVRFRDLDPTELAAILVALCPDQFKGVLGGTHQDGYCSKLGYARPLGWGSVHIEAKQLLLLDEASEVPTLKPEANLSDWAAKHHRKTATQDEWLAIHRRNHPDAADYPRAAGNENIYTYHTRLRAEHSRNRRYKMRTLLIMTTGQTDVQFVKDGQRHKLDGKTCGTLHDAIKERSWTVVDTPPSRSGDPINELPDGDLVLCTPKLDAVLAHIAPNLPTSVLILETQREYPSDPRHTGEFMERRLRDRGVEHVTRLAFLTDKEHLEDTSNDFDAVVRRSVVATLSDAIADATAGLEKGDRVFVATTGGLAAANELINELVRLHCIGGPTAAVLEVPDGKNGEKDDRAVEEKFHPAAGYRARWHALSLVEKGNLLGAWGAVSHLEGTPGQEWTQVIKWLSQFASSLPFEPPLPQDSGLAVLGHRRMAVRAALRVELALRAGDIPRAVHGTVAFFESALWDHLLEHFERDPNDARFLKLKAGAVAPTGTLLRDGDNDDLNCPFEQKSRSDGQAWYWFHESGAGRFARDYVKSDPLKKLTDAINQVKALRNDVAHNEPTPTLMENARTRMQKAKLWSDTDQFLSQPLVQDVLRELGEENSQDLLANLLAEIRLRLRAPSAEDSRRGRAWSSEVCDDR